MTEVISLKNAEHYTWGNNCDGWHFLNTDNLSIIRECVPPNGVEIKHLHEHSVQFFYILSGVCTMLIGSRTLTLRAGEGCHIEPGTIHQLINNDSEDLHFLVISNPKSHGDRVIVP
jgi:mannose-6-phosphate isomerase-like protein (cupin superfamily)